MSSRSDFTEGGEPPPQVQMESCDCPMGCPPADTPVVSGRDLENGLPGNFTVVRCRTCSLMRTNPRPTPATIGFYYPSDYAPFRLDEPPLPSSVGTRKLGSLKRLLRGIVDFKVEALPKVETGRLLEVGCSTGVFLARMQARGWDVEGIEPSAHAASAAQARGLHVHVSPIDKSLPRRDDYDLIVGWMVLEHTHDPVVALRRMREWIGPQGHLVLSVPNAGTFQTRLFGSSWYSLSLPHHLFHFTPKTVRAVLDRAGWDVTRIVHQRVLSDPIASLGYVLRRSGRVPSVAERLVDFPKRAGGAHYLLYPIARALAAIGQTGRMTIWARPSR